MICVRSRVSNPVRDPMRHPGEATAARSPDGAGAQGSQTQTIIGTATAKMIPSSGRPMRQ